LVLLRTSDAIPEPILELGEACCAARRRDHAHLARGKFDRDRFAKPARGTGHEGDGTRPNNVDIASHA